MKERELLKEIEKRLKDFFEENRFVYLRGSESYVQDMQDLDKRVSFSCARWAQSDSWHVDHYVKLRLHKIQEIVDRYKPYLSGKEKLQTVTVSTYFYNFVPPEFDWSLVTLSTMEEVPRVVDNLKIILNRYSFPVLGKWSNLDEIVRSLDKAQDEWLVSGPIERFEVLLAFSVIRGERQEIEKYVSEIVQFCKGRSDFYANSLINLANGVANDFLV